MASLVALLTFPKSSKALTNLKTSVSETHTNDNIGSASPRRKVPRLDTDSDSASASRSHSASTANLTVGLGKSGPLTVHLGVEIFSNHVSGDREFALLRRCIRIVLNPAPEEVLPATNYEIYCACRTVVSFAKRGEGLYDTLQIELEKCVDSLVRVCTQQGKSPIEWINFFLITCTWFEERINRLVALLTYLDQEYIVNNTTSKSVRSMAYGIFEESIFGNPTITENLRSGIQEWVESERNSKKPHTHRLQIPLLIKHLITHNQYAKFEDHYVSITREYYTEESERLSKEQEKDPQAFFTHVQSRIFQEEERSKDVLPTGSWSLLRETTERALWDGRLEWLAYETVGPYMTARDTVALEAMYNLFGRVDGLKTLCAAFRKHIVSSVSEIVNDTARDEEMVDRLLELRRLADTIIEKSFSTDSSSSSTLPTTASTSSIHKHADQSFVYALSDAVTTGFKSRRSKPAEMIAKYLDNAMRKGQGESTDAEFDAMLDDALGLYRFSEDKDVFRTFYHRSLAKRLLLGKSASNDFEVSMLKRMKEKYDPEFGMGEDMFKDLALSKENMGDYHSKMTENDPGRKLNAMVLQRSAWPFSKSNKIVDLPPNMQEQLSKFSVYYKGKHSGHTLDWDHALGMATLVARFTPGVKELSVSLYQAVVLLLFNESSTLPFQDIKDQTRMDDSELRRTLQSLACGKKKVLKKIPAGRDVNDDDQFRFNADFADPRAKIHINSIQAKVSPEESKRTNEAVEGDRKFYIDAAIVRLMKANKSMSYEKIKTATIDAVKNHFVPQVEVIKQRVDSLVEGEYLRRDKNDRNRFHYVA